MKILFLANLIPFPLDGGGKIFTHSIIEALSINNDIDLVCFYEHEDVLAAKKDLYKYCKRIKTLPIRVTTKENMSLMMKKALWSLFSLRPLAVSKYKTKAMSSSLQKILKKNDYDCVFINLLAMGVYYQDIMRACPKINVVLYEQNCEALIYKRLFEQEKRMVKKLFLGVEYYKLDRFEQKTIKQVDKVITLSEEDKENLRLQHADVIPIGVRPQEYQKQYSKGMNSIVRMLFVGTMTWAPNNEGIIWFLKEVMPLCEDPTKFQLSIVGKNPSEEVLKLSKKYSNVFVKGYVESLDAEYDNADVLIVPLFVGSGQRVKIIEAFARRFAVISTTIGAEGLKYDPDRSIMIADSKEDFMKQLERCRDASYLDSVASAGKCIFDTTYSTNVIEKRLNEMLIRIGKKGC